MHIFKARCGRHGGEKEVARDSFVIDARLLRYDPVGGHKGISLGGQRTRRDQQRQLLLAAGHEMPGQVHLTAGVPQLAARPTVHEHPRMRLQHREREFQATTRPSVRHCEAPLVPRLIHITDTHTIFQPRGNPHLLHTALRPPFAVRPHARHLEPSPAIACRRHGRGCFVGQHRPEAPQAVETDTFARCGGLPPGIRDRFGFRVGTRWQRRIRLDHRAQAADSQ